MTIRPPGIKEASTVVNLTAILACAAMIKLGGLRSIGAESYLPTESPRNKIKRLAAVLPCRCPRNRELMNETTSTLSQQRSDTVRALTNALEIDGVSLSGALLEMLDRVDVLLSVKEVSTGRYVHVNRAMADFLGRPSAELVGSTDADVLEQGQTSAIRTAEQTALAHAAPMLSEHRIDRAGQKREFSVVRLALPRADGSAARHVLGVWVEQTLANQREHQLQNALAQLEQQQLAAEVLRRETQDQSLRDNATGLYQRLHFDDQLRREVDLSSREHREFALVSIALDPFSDAVKALGAEATARILEALGRLLRGNTRAMDASCRLDEDRFAVLLSGVGLATAHSRMEGLRRQCATQIVVLSGRDLGFTVSMGVASFPHTAHTDLDLMTAADKALAEARKRGGNHVALASIRFELGGV
jgi:diguanylate cyclase (GGDEF)-like protein